MQTISAAARGLLLAALALTFFPLTACAQAEVGAPDMEKPNVMSEHHPGVTTPYPAALQKRLAAAVAAKGADYEPRTEHHAPDGGARYTNRLILEGSPYLLQHAHNPVDWYPWGPEAFERAKEEGKPIFLSIGYSTCHWCHVMERESFESEAIAKVMNEKFICIKIDREQRPDIDDLYMTAVQLLTGRGGWPMSSFLTPEGKPFFGGTYFPPAQFEQLLDAIDESWQTRRGEIEESAERITAAVREVTSARGAAAEVGEAIIGRAVAQTLERFDPELGGFGRAPKFPHEPELLLLLDRALRHGDGAALGAAEQSLTAMAEGGIYDQVGGGFHRYSVDAHWLVPHFEKMLYNQAHLSRAYVVAYRLTGRPFYARVARQTLDYVIKEMTAPSGGFYSATDADSEGEEGTFFLWTPETLRAALDEKDAALVQDLYGVTEGGNFEGRSILHLPRSLEDYAAAKAMPLATLLERLDRIRATLWTVREEREHPLRDDKVLTAWNGMMITAFAQAAEILGEDRYLAAAVRAAEFLWAESRRGEGDLWRVHIDDAASVPALQEDYAYLLEALVSLYDASGDDKWLTRAKEVADGMLKRFWDDEGGGFFMSAAGGDPHLLTRPKSPSDGATPSGNSVAVRALAMLAARSGETRYSDRASATVSAFASAVAQQPAGFGYMLGGVDVLLNGDVGPRQYAARGAVRALAMPSPIKDGVVEVTIALRMGEAWHINAHQPLQETLIPTVLSVDTGRGPWQLEAAHYPEPETVDLSFQEEPLAIYQGTAQLTARITAGDSAALGHAAVIPLRLKLQACNDRLCLEPEEVLLEVPVTRGQSG